MKHHDAFGIHESGRGVAAGLTKLPKLDSGLRRGEEPLPEDWNQMAAGREHVLHFDGAWVSGWYLLWFFPMRAPTDDVEQAETAVVESVVALDATTPPLAKMAARPELHQLVLVVGGPARESKVIVTGRDPTGAAAKSHLAVVGDVHLRVGAIYFLADNDLALQAGHLWELGELFVGNHNLSWSVSFLA